MDSNMEHDDRCNMQDRDLTLLKEQFRRSEELFRDVVARVQLLINQFHAQNVSQAEIRGDVAHIRGKVDDIERSLEKDFPLRSEFVEVKSEWRKFLGIVLAAVLAAVLGLIGIGVKGGLR
jgi:hypothetical protein